MITIIYNEDAMEDYPEFPPCVMTTTIENEGMSWPDLMGVFARQLPHPDNGRRKISVLGQRTMHHLWTSKWAVDTTRI